MIALTEGVQTAVVITGGSVLVAIIGLMGSILTLQVKAGTRGKRVDAKTEELKTNGGTSLADKVNVTARQVSSLAETVAAITENQTTTALRHNENQASILALVVGQRELERRIMDYQVMSAGERAVSNERLATLQAAMTAHTSTPPVTGEVPVTT